MVWKAIVIIIALAWAGLTAGSMIHAPARQAPARQVVAPALITLHMGNAIWTCANDGANSYNCAVSSQRFRQ